MKNKDMINALYADTTEFDVELVKNVAKRLQILNGIVVDRNNLERGLWQYLLRFRIIDREEY